MAHVLLNVVPNRDGSHPIRGLGMSTLPTIDSIDYKYLVWFQRHRVAQQAATAKLTQQTWFRNLLKVLANALAFLRDTTVIRGMQLELQ